MKFVTRLWPCVVCRAATANPDQCRDCGRRHLCATCYAHHPRPCDGVAAKEDAA